MEYLYVQKLGHIWLQVGIGIKMRSICVIAFQAKESVPLQAHEPHDCRTVVNLSIEADKGTEVMISSFTSLSFAYSWEQSEYF